MTAVEGQSRPGSGVAGQTGVVGGPVVGLASQRVGECVVELARRMAEFELLSDVAADTDRGPRLTRVVIDRAEDARRRLVELEDQVLVTLGRLQAAADPRRGTDRDRVGELREIWETGAGAFVAALDAAMTDGVALLHALRGAGHALEPLAQGLVTDPNLLEDAVPTLFDVQRHTARAILAATGLLSELKVAEATAPAWTQPRDGRL